MASSSYFRSVSDKLSAKRNTTSSSSTSSCEVTPKSKKMVDSANSKKADHTEKINDKLSCIVEKLETIHSSPVFVSSVKNIIDDSLSTFMEQLLQKMDDKLARYDSRIVDLEIENDELQHELIGTKISRKH